MNKHSAETAVLVPSCVIDASAGSGKTEELGKRLVGMMLAGIPPGSIATMTFTRMAAGEIYERLIRILCKAALDPSSHEDLIRDLNRLGFQTRGEGPWRFTPDGKALKELLRELISSMNSLRIGTLDSFMAQIVQSFPVELGLPGECSMLDEAEGESLRDDLLRILLDYSSSPPGMDEDFIEAGKEAAYGKGNKLFFDASRDLIASAETFYSWRLPRYSGLWNPIPALPRHDDAGGADRRKQAFERCREWSLDFEEKLRAAEKAVPPSLSRLISTLEICRDAGPETPFSRENLKILNAFFEVWENFLKGEQKPQGFSRGYDFSTVMDPLILLLSHAGELLLHQASVRTGGMRSMLQLYADLYRKRVLEEGKIAFADLPRLLNNEEAEEWIFDIAYRLNGKLCHWLIDEFQDTSRDQWRILSRIIESVQDTEHSLFLVGDVKQAVYGWRGGDSRLIDEAAEEFSLLRSPKSMSYRYGPEISSALNELFSPAKMDLSAFPEDTKERWKRIWQDHESAPSTKTGSFQVWQILDGVPGKDGGAAEQNPDDDKKEDLITQYAVLIAAELKKISPWDRGLESAVLVRSKQDGIRLKDAVMQLDPEIGTHLIWEGEESIVNDKIVAALLALAVHLQHPGNTLCAEVVQMTPPVAGLLPANAEDMEKMRSLLVLNGFHDTFLSWIRTIPEEYGTADNRNLDQLLSAARSFDSSASARGDAVRFRDFAAQHMMNESAVRGKVRIMTIHHSKGLGMDLVFTILKNNQKSSLRNPVYTGFLRGKKKTSGEDGMPEWLLYSPGPAGALHREIREAACSKTADAAMEELCTLYVALTRAKRGAWLLLPPLSAQKRAAFHPDLTGLTKTGKPKKFTPSLISGFQDSYYISDYVFDSLFGSNEKDFPKNETLRIRSMEGIPCLTFQRGTPDWYESIRPAPALERPMTFSFSSATGSPGLVRRTRITPSSADDEEIHPLSFTLPDAESPAELGRQIHSLFEQVEFLDEFFLPPEEELLEEKQEEKRKENGEKNGETGGAAVAAISSQIRSHVEHCLKNPETRALLSRPSSGRHLLWRERPFEVITEDGLWISGRFDRVLIELDSEGFRPVRAVLVDFKSDRIAPALSLREAGKPYEKQMSLYRNALSSLLKLPQERIQAYLVFTRTGESLFLPLNSVSATTQSPGPAAAQSSAGVSEAEIPSPAGGTGDVQASPEALFSEESGNGKVHGNNRGASPAPPEETASRKGKTDSSYCNDIPDLFSGSGE